jgi:hypothetical protein
MRVAVNMSREVYDYFKGYDLSAVADTLLEMYDFTDLPPTSGRRDVERTVNVCNAFYIEQYNMFGPRSKKVSLGRLFEFAFNMNVLELPRFEIFKADKIDDPVPALLDKAYRSLLMAEKYDTSAELKQVTNLVYSYKGVYDESVRNRNL